MRILIAALLAVFSASAAPRPLDVYVIDVEGGKAMLVVSPSGESMLVDAGWPAFNGRDVDRIAATAKAAKVKRIDYLVITHLDVDHVGNLKLLASKLPIGRILDNGPLQTTGKGVEKRYKVYAEVRDSMDHATLQAGDRIPIKGVQVDVVAAGAKFITKPLDGGGIPNPACAVSPQPPEIPQDLEDNMSIGLLFTFGRFRMIDLGDLESHYDYELMCPNNPVGTVDVYHVSVHGQEKGGSAALVGGLRPRVAIMANGARKGGDPQTWPRLRSAPGLEDIWQLHYSLAGGKDRNPPDVFVANLDPDCEGKGLKLSAQADGTFTVTNTRNRFTRTYSPRK
jgi:beta-lactamase superfamily II metal-dependent hydrolase